MQQIIEGRIAQGMLVDDEAQTERDLQDVFKEYDTKHIRITVTDHLCDVCNNSFADCSACSIIWQGTDAVRMCDGYEPLQTVRLDWVKWLRDRIWDMDIPSPTTNEAIELHKKMTRILQIINMEVAKHEG